MCHACADVQMFTEEERAAPVQRANAHTRTYACATVNARVFRIHNNMTLIQVETFKGVLSRVHPHAPHAQPHDTRVTL